jgi:tetratricopeptide (TPR) repeat protein
MPKDRALYCNTVAVNHYAKTVAYAASGDVVAAERESAEFQAARAEVVESRMLFNNSCIELLEIADQMQRGEIEYRKGNYDAAFLHLRKSVDLDDGLPYSEPWGWMQPTRHALGALLLEQDHLEEAAAVYRADLGLDNSLRRAMQHMENVWSLHGLHECLTRLGHQDDAAMLRPRLNVALARADVPIRSSCFCRLHDAA